MEVLLQYNVRLSKCVTPTTAMILDDILSYESAMIKHAYAVC